MDSFDRIVAGIIVGLIAAIGVVVALGDHVGVRIVETTPTAGGVPPATTPIRITFGEAVEAETVEANFAVEPAVDGTFNWAGRTVTYMPAKPFEVGETYRVTVGPGVVSESGRVMSRSVSWTFTPRSSAVLYLSPTSGEEPRAIWKVPVETGEHEQLFAPEHGISDYEASPDGTQIAATVLNEDFTANLWLMDAEGGNARQILNCAPGNCAGLTWSPDGALIAYERQEQAATTGGLAPTRIWLYDVASGETAPVFEDNQVLGFSPTFSPDGGRLAFFDGNTQAIRVVDLNSGALTVIPSQMGEVGSFSPDGKQMIYVDIRAVGRQYFPELWLADIGGEGSVRRLRENAEEDHYPVWSPDGEWIAFSSRLLDRTEGWASQLMLYNVETGETQQVTDDTKYNHTLFVWSPGGEKLLVQRFDITATFAVPALWLYDMQTDALTLLVEDAANGQWLP